MRSASFFVLLIEIVLFILIALKCAWEFIATWPRCRSLLGRLGYQGELVLTTAEDAEEITGTTGVGARRTVQGMLAVACIARATLTTFVLVRDSWVPYLALPDLAYLSIYSLLVVFLAQMLYITVGFGYMWVKLAAWASFAVVLVVSLIVCTMRWGTNPLSQRSLLLRKILYYELGITYLSMFLAFVYFGSQICLAAKTNRSLFYRIVLLMSVCGAALLSKGIFFVVIAANAWHVDDLTPLSSGRHGFEACVALEELLPSIVISVLTSRGESPRFPLPSPSEVTGFARFGSPIFSVYSLSPGQSPGQSPTRSFTYGSNITQP